MGVELIIAGVAATAALAGGGIAAYSQYQAGKAQNAAAQAQAQQLQIQAENERARASVAQLQGQQEAERRYLQLSQDIGSMYANFAGNGLEISNSGTVGSALKTTVTEAGQDVKTIEDNTRMNVWGHLANATQYMNQSSLAIFQGKSAKKSATLGAIGTGVGAVGSAIGAFGGGLDLGNKLKTEFPNTFS